MSVEAFVAAAAERGCRVVRAASEADAVSAVQELCAGRPTLVDAVPALTGANVGSRPADAWSAELGVTAAWGAAADTGTVALVRGAGSARATSALPLTSVVLVDAEDVLPTYAELVLAVAGLEPRPSNVQLVTGASRSGDVQGITVHGMHGPAELVLVVY